MHNNSSSITTKDKKQGRYQLHSTHTHTPKEVVGDTYLYDKIGSQQYLSNMLQPTGGLQQ
jgi:hypothetical protein